MFYSNANLNRLGQNFNRQLNSAICQRIELSTNNLEHKCMCSIVHKCRLYECNHDQIQSHLISYYFQFNSKLGPNILYNTNQVSPYFRKVHQHIMLQHQTSAAAAPAAAATMTQNTSSNQPTNWRPSQSRSACEVNNGKEYKSSRDRNISALSILLVDCERENIYLLVALFSIQDSFKLLQRLKI